MTKAIIISFLAILSLMTAIKAQPSDQDAEYLKLTKEYVLNTDGSFDFHYRKEIRLLTHFSFHRLFGETFIVYNPQYQALKINESYTVMADGKKIITPVNAYNEVLPGFARDVAAYNHLREMVVTHTGTEVGAVITLDYTIHSTGGFLPFFFGMEEIGENVDVKELDLIIRVPAEITLQYRMLNNRTAPEITELAGQRSFTWNIKNIPALPRSGNQDPERKAQLQFSIARDMTWAFFSFVNQPAFKHEISPAISKRVDAVTKEKKDELDIILALQGVVIDELKYADIPLAYTGYKVRTPAVVWQSANAGSLEKAILLSEMLVKANINAYPVATVPNGWFSREMGNPAAFDGYMVQVNPKKLGRIYLSVTQKQSQNMLFDILDKTIIQLDPAVETMRTFQEKPVTHLLKMEAELKIDAAKNLSGDLELQMEGIVNPYFRLYKDSSYVKSILAGDLTQQMARPEITTLSEARTRAVVTVNPAALKNDYQGYIYIDLPRFKNGFDSWNLVQFTGSDNTPVKLDHHLWENYSIRLTLPDGYSLFTPPADVLIKNALGDLEIGIRQSGQVVTIYRSWEHSHDVITSDNLDEFREMIKAWENPNWRRIVVKME